MITVVGSANMDLAARVARLPSPGQTVLASGFIRSPGGKGANQAVAAARAGSPTAFVGRVGEDGYGLELLASLQHAGVSTEYAVRDPEHPTGMAMIHVDDNGENTIVVIRGANAYLAPIDVDRARSLVTRSRLLLLQLEIPEETVVYAARVAHEADALVVLNPSPCRELEPALLKSVDVLVLNEEEVAVLSGMGAPLEPASAGRLLLNAGAGAVIVTLGAQGAVLVTPGNEVEVPTFPVNPVDSTGAGDAFVGNLAHALAGGQNLEQAARFAAAAATLSVQVSGAQTGMPTASQTKALLGGENPP